MKKLAFVTILEILPTLASLLGNGSSQVWASQIAFVSYAFKPEGEIFVINPDGTILQNLQNPQTPRWVAWSPEGERIAVATYTPVALYIMEADGRNLTRLLSNYPSSSRPTWSPDGTKIAFTTFQELIVLDIETMDKQRLFFHPMDNGLGDPAWSPGGTKIAFTIRHERQRDIYVINADGTGLRRLTDHSAEDHAPAWSPDGKQIAFFSSRDGKRGTCLINSDGTDFKRLTEDNEDYPSWSPTGSHIVFWSTANRSKIGVMEANGEALRILFEGYSPSWRPFASVDVNPDGKRSLIWGSLKAAR